MRHYIGIFVGGLKDGEKCESDRPEILVYEFSPVPVSYGTSSTPVPEHVPCRKHIYRWFALMVEYELYGLFVHQSLTFPQALQRVVESYAGAHKTEKEAGL